MMKTSFISTAVFFLSLLPLFLQSQKSYELKSPDGNISVKIVLDDNVHFEVLLNENRIVDNVVISMKIKNGAVLGDAPALIKVLTDKKDELIEAVIPEKNRLILNRYNEMKFLFKGDYSLTFRAFDNGIAYRFGTNFKDSIIIESEQSDIRFPENTYVYFPEEKSFMSHNECTYIYEKLCGIGEDRFCSTPALVETAAGIKVLITESGLTDYAGMWLKGGNGEVLNAIFPAVALSEELKRDRDLYVTRRADYIAVTEGARFFPWRIFAIAKNDGELITNQLTYLLAQPCAIDDPSWIKPGKVAWDWWNALNLYNVDFHAGVNTETYKYFIDFAADYGIEYIIMDEGWYELGDLLKLNPDINMKEILSYAKEKNVGVILWVVWKTLWDQWDEAFGQFEKWGVAGLKVDFMQRDDQWMVNYYHKTAEEAAKRHLLVDFHGSYKPAGLRRKYPNVITREGVHGLEHNKWGEEETPHLDVTLPFIRMVAGPMDYTPGAMVNAQKDNFRAIWSRPMSQGTRCHQLAMYVVYESPLQMLADSPSHYYGEPECMEFLSPVPSVWDTTIVLNAKTAGYIALARRSLNGEWYVGVMTDKPIDMILDFTFLDNGVYNIQYFADGVNAERYASDYVMKKGKINKDGTMKIHLATGGGWAARLTK